MALTYVRKPDQAGETVKAAQALGVKALVIQADSADAKAGESSTSGVATPNARPSRVAGDTP